MSIFFDDTAPDADDATIDGERDDVRIICEFEDLPSSLILDVDYPTSLNDEYLLNEDGSLEIHKVYKCSLKKSSQKGIYARAIHPSTEGVSDLLLLKNADLKKRAEDLQVDIKEVDTRVNTQLRRKIWASADDLNVISTEVPLDKESTKQIWEQLKKHMPAYALFKSDRPSTDQDAEAQDPMKAAVKEAIKEKEADLAEISKYVEQQVKDIAEKTVSKLREMDPDLASQLNPRFSQPNWANVFKMSLTGDEEIPINKRGSGVRRLILLNFFRAKVDKRASERNATNVIYAIEEPETCQHPNSQLMLFKAFTELSEDPYCQVMISTHTPVLARNLPLESLRYISVEPDRKRKIYTGDEDTTYKAVAKALGVLPDHNVKLFIGVEGGNDINFLRNISHILRESGEDVPDLSQLEDDGQVMFIPVGGSNLVLWASRLERFNRPEFHLFDRSAQSNEISPNQRIVDEINARPDCTAYLTGKLEIENYIHPEAIKSVRPEVDISFGDFDDVPALVAEAIHNASDSTTAWSDLDEVKKGKKQSQAKRWLNVESASLMSPELLSDRDPNNELRSWLQEIGRLLDAYDSATFLK